MGGGMGGDVLWEIRRTVVGVVGHGLGADGETDVDPACGDLVCY